MHRDVGWPCVPVAQIPAVGHSTLPQHPLRQGRDTPGPCAMVHAVHGRVRREIVFVIGAFALVLSFQITH